MILPEFANLLVSGGVGVLGTTLFLGRLPETPDDVVVLYESGGTMPVYSLGAAAVDRPTVQVLARARVYATGRQKIEDAYRLLDGVLNQVLSGVYYLSITPMQPPFVLRRDENDRTEFAFNVLAERVRS